MQINKNSLNKIIIKSKNRYDLWTLFLLSITPKNLCEIGVWKGEFAYHLLSNVNSIKKYYLIDPWTNLKGWNKPANVSNKIFKEIKSEAVHKLKSFNNTKFIQKCTKEAMNEIKNSSIDFVYIDGDHSLRGITLDLISIFPKIKKMGFLLELSGKHLNFII